MVEIWAPVAGYEGLYEVSNLGRVKSLSRVQPDGRRRSERILRLNLAWNGYLRVALCRFGVVKHLPAHRLVADAFCERREGCESVNHRDGVKTNNEHSNLEWCTKSENSCHARDVLHVSHMQKNSQANNNPARAVVGIPVDGGDLLRFPSSREAGRSGFSQGLVSACCLGKRKHHKGYQWRYA